MTRRALDTAGAGTGRLARSVQPANVAAAEHHRACRLRPRRPPPTRPPGRNRSGTATLIGMTVAELRDAGYRPAYRAGAARPAGEAPGLVVCCRGVRPALRPLVCTVLLAMLSLFGCEEMIESTIPDEPRPEGSFTPQFERVVGFPALYPSLHFSELQVAQEEARRVSVMHGRGGTGTAQIVGVFDSGAAPSHIDLEGKFAHTCAMGDCDDGRPNRSDHSPWMDTNDHGTAVNGVIAARKNGTGMYGVAYEARIASYGNTASVHPPWGTGCVERGCTLWSELFDSETARGVDWMNTLGARVVNNSWSRTYGWSKEKEIHYGLSKSSVRNFMPQSLRAYQSYIDADGIVVWAAGNRGDSLHPDVEAMLPRYFPNLEQGWLVVVALGMNGRIASFSSACGAAARWCIAAPGELVTTHRDGRWRLTGGTSVAAPYVAGSLAALKSMFTNLTYQEIRACILETADKVPPYDDRMIYGQGRLNLDAATRRCRR